MVTYLSGLRLGLLLALGVTLPEVVPAQPTPTRLADREVEQLVDRIDDRLDRFEDALAHDFKRSVLRGPQGELDIDQWLDDFDDKVDQLEDRLDDDYSASSEAADLLTHASRLPVLLATDTPGGAEGGSEWRRLAEDLEALARAYGTPFPVPAGATVRRLTDRELAEQARLLAKDVDRLDDILDDELEDLDVGDDGRDAAEREVEELERAAERLEDRIEDHEPASAEAERVFVQAARVRARIAPARMPKSSAVWGSIDERLRTLAMAFGTVW